MDELRILAATGAIGYGIPEDGFNRALEFKPHMIGADMGTTDAGPFYLGSGEIGKGRHACKSDISMIIKAGRKLNIPVVIGSAGTAGGEPHLQWTLDIVREIAQENQLKFKLAIIHADFDKDYLHKKLEEEKIKPCGPLPDLTPGDIDNSVRIVGQMGPEPMMEALRGGAHVVLAGRASDVSIYAAFPLMLGYDKGLVMHMGKIIECGSACADPGGKYPIIAYLNRDHFILETMDKNQRTTPVSVAAHTMYENHDPYLVDEPGGTLDVRDAVYEQIDPLRTKVSRSKWIEAPDYTIKLEGAAMVGHRWISIGGIRDPILISQIDTVLAAIAEDVQGRMKFSGIDKEQYKLQFRVYGKNAVMGIFEPQKEFHGHEIAVLVDVLGESSDIAKTVCAATLHRLLHQRYPGILCNTGNVAFPFSPREINLGPSYNFNVYHTVIVDNPLQPFPIEYITF